MITPSKIIFVKMCRKNQNDVFNFFVKSRFWLNLVLFFIPKKAETLENNTFHICRSLDFDLIL